MTEAGRYSFGSESGRTNLPRVADQTRLYRTFLLFALATVSMVPGTSTTLAQGNTTEAAVVNQGSFLLPSEIPAPSGNKPTADRIEVGKMLFFDPRLSGSNWISCASCHNPSLGWSDGLPTGVGEGMRALGRKTPSIVNSAFNALHMWDGRMKSFAALGIAFVVSQISISALPEPGKTESYLASRAKHALVRGNSRGIAPPPTPTMEASPAEGEKLFGVECAACHGMEGTTPSDAGRWMSPRAANLSAPDVQRYSDVELFWIVKNGIRLSGMPGFGAVESDANIWNLVRYVRSLRATQQQAIGHE